jgi:hypothetical protein
MQLTGTIKTVSQDDNLGPVTIGAESQRGLRPFKSKKDSQAPSSSDDFDVANIKREKHPSNKRVQSAISDRNDWKQKQDRMDVYNLQKRFS